MKEFKGYKEHNEKRDTLINQIENLFDLYNRGDYGSGDTLEEEILDKYNCISISELSTATLINIYESLLNEQGVSYGNRNKRNTAEGSSRRHQRNE